jgi:hypothetical protein
MISKTPKIYSARDMGGGLGIIGIFRIDSLIMTISVENIPELISDLTPFINKGPRKRKERGGKIVIERPNGWRVTINTKKDGNK